MATVSAPMLSGREANSRVGGSLERPSLSEPQSEDDEEEADVKEVTTSQMDRVGGNVDKPMLPRRRSVHTLHSTAFDLLLEALLADYDLVRSLAENVGYDRMEVIVAPTPGTS
jgi:hypothetical protein